MSDVSRGTLFGIPVRYSADLPPQAIEVRHARGIHLPLGWGLMDNASRLVWLHENVAGVEFTCGVGAEEWMFTTMTEERPS